MREAVNPTTSRPHASLTFTSFASDSAALINGRGLAGRAPPQRESGGSLPVAVLVLGQLQLLLPLSQLVEDGVQASIWRSGRKTHRATGRLRLRLGGRGGASLTSSLLRSPSIPLRGRGILLLPLQTGRRGRCEGCRASSRSRPSSPTRHNAAGAEPVREAERPCAACSPVGEGSVAGEGPAERRHDGSERAKAGERSLELRRSVNGAYCETPHFTHPNEHEATFSSV